MRKLTVSLGERSYAILIGRGLLDQGALIAEVVRAPRVAIVTNETVAPLYLSRLEGALSAQGIESRAIVLPDGEAFKNLDTLNTIFDGLLRGLCDRSTTVIALGGGVIGDMAGFAAATYQRGVDFVQIPTTLLAQVDSSVGGKTAVNHPLGKNMIGAFHQPRRVIADTDTLSTLPDRELRAGLAEVIKYGLIRDADFFDWLEAHMDGLLGRDPTLLSEAIERSCANKAKIVAEDETERGVRALLNLGHTFGHAIEAGLGYGEWLHGEAVGAGMVMAARLSQGLGYLSSEQCERAVALIADAGLPVTGPALGADRYLALMAHDKKVEAGRLRLVLLRDIGDAEIFADVPADQIRAAIAQCCVA
ncbi:3-dehydroquinate synthase [Nitrogeniibacter mangrovi]|uniref:3-dehydroquinate synthase n=1 Tax=Nitrogeniibacter mangrovi TaxID=2016596 RepID=A0A6C1AZL0_9RHOO|nr:3-dehydroquinate synthase [Nitrogeniibacter mangrovi]QID16792.1 3-dehydroquinate synthase [Nitrogeniibacter mangrovi]